MTKGYVSEIFSSFQGEGVFAGRRHLFLRLGGCNLRCGYCDTPESLERTATCAIYAADGSKTERPNPLAVSDVRAMLAPLLSIPGLHALAITGGEPLVQSGFIAELLSEARPPVPVLLETNGTYPDRLEAVLPFVDILSVDVKLPSNSSERPFWDEHAAFLAKGIGKTMYVKVPIDERTMEQEIARAAALVSELPERPPFFLQPIVSPANELCISPTRLDRFYDVASSRLSDVRVMPQAHKALGIR
jgi:organic radical activating enzyme